MADTNYEAFAPGVLLRLAAAGIPAFRTPESCADAIAAVLRRRAPVPAPANMPTSGEGRFIDEAEAYARLRPLGLPISDYAVLAVDGDTQDAPAFPVAVKACAAALPHKSDVGGVVLNVADAATLRTTTAQIAANVARARPNITLRQVLVQSMATGVGEVLIGFRRDADVGPIVMLAAGGVLAEILGDRTLRLAPIDLAGAIAVREPG